MPEGPVIRVVTWAMRGYSVRMYRLMSCVKIDCQTASRSRAVAVELPTMFSKIAWNARATWKQTAKTCSGRYREGRPRSGISRYALELLAELRPALDGPAPVGGLQRLPDRLEEHAHVAVVEHVADEFLVEAEIRLGRVMTGAESFPGVVGQTSRRRRCSVGTLGNIAS